MSDLYGLMTLMMPVCNAKCGFWSITFRDPSIQGYMQTAMGQLANWQTN